MPSSKGWRVLMIEQPDNVRDKDEVRRASSDQVFQIIFDTRPLDPDRAGCGGAIALCWLDVDTLADAEKTAVENLLAEGWRPVNFWEYRIVNADSDEYRGGVRSDEEIDEILGDVAMAQRDGFSTRFYANPSDELEH